MKSSQSEERTMVFTRQKNETSNMNRERSFFTCEKNDTSNQKLQRCCPANRDYGRFPFNPKFRKFLLVHQMERTISVWSDRNIRNQHWRWSTVTGLVISVGRTEMCLSICQNCCPQYHSFVSCLQEQVVSNGKSNILNQLQFFSIFDICHKEWLSEKTGQFLELYGK